MAAAKKGDTVHIHYTGRLDDGTIFDSSENREPLSFEVGSGTVIPGFDDAVDGMVTGEKKTTTIPAAEAYGPRQDEMMVTVPRDQLPPGVAPEVGQILQMSDPTGEQFNVVVAEVTEDALVLDGNHPLAGKDLTFDIELVKID